MTEPEKTESAHTATSESTDAPASEPAPEPVEAKDDDDDDDDDEKKSKSKKKKQKDKAKDEDDEDKDDEDEDEDEDEGPKKAKISFEATMPRNEAVSYFEAIVAGLRSGRLEFKQGDQTVVLNPPDHLEIEVKAKSKGDKGSVVFEIEWSDENRPLEISN